MNFRLVPMSELGKKHFEEWPVWSEYYEPDDIEDIQKWGIDPNSFWAEMKARNFEEVAYPVLEYDPHAGYMRVYIKAQFITQSGRCLDGYIINEDAYAGGIFIGEEEFSFNVRLHDLNLRMLEDFASHLGTKPEELYSFKFETDFYDSDGNPIAGIIDL
jgi:hypothetical protein